MNRTRIATFAAITFLAAGAALASWYDDYEAGTAAARKGQWSVVIQKMNAAIAGNSKEGDKTRTYGAIFINYHPYYYRGVAYLNTGKIDQAIADFEKTSGPGDTDLGTLDTLMQRAKSRQAEANAPEPAPPPVPVPQPRQVAPPPTPVPSAPVMDQNLRSQVAAAISAANGSLAGAQKRKAASSPQYTQAIGALADANGKLATAHTNDDLNAALAAATNAKLYADAAAPPGVAPLPVIPVAPRPVAAAGVVMADAARGVRSALESYFAGDFDQATRSFQKLTQTLPNNAWIYAFLGASQYSQYAFEADESYKSAAMQSFRKAKQSGKFKNGLPERYFSKRIRNVFKDLS